jgi:hemerythrin-like domain-containing protein
MTDQHESQEQDAALADELRAHHAVMIRDLDRLSTALVDAAGPGGDPAPAKRELEEWVTEFLVPHAEEEEATTYRAAGDLPAGELLIVSMLAEHDLIRLTARHMSEAGDPVAAGAFARALFDTFDSHQRKENDIILPLLVESDTVSLTEVMAGAHGHDHSHDHDHDHGHGHAH